MEQTPTTHRRTIAEYLVGKPVSEADLTQAVESAQRDPKLLGFIAEEFGLRGNTSSCQAIQARGPEIATAYQTPGFKDEFPEFYAHLTHCSHCASYLAEITSSPKNDHASVGI